MPITDTPHYQSLNALDPTEWHMMPDASGASFTWHQGHLYLRDFDPDGTPIYSLFAVNLEVRGTEAIRLLADMSLESGLLLLYNPAKVELVTNARDPARWPLRDRVADALLLAAIEWIAESKHLNDILRDPLVLGPLLVDLMTHGGLPIFSQSAVQDFRTLISHYNNEDE